MMAALLRNSLLAGRRRGGARGTAAPLPRRGDGYEFAELRGYVAGDDPRRIDWAATARAGALQTRVVFEEHGLTLASCLDASPSMHVGRTRSGYDLACEAATIWYSIASGEDRCTRVADEQIISAPHLRGRAAGAFCATQRAGAARLGNALGVALALLPRDAYLLVVSDYFDIDSIEDLLRACGRRFDTTALCIRDAWHEGLPLRGFVTLRDAENGRTMRTFIGPREGERYAQAVRAREAEVAARLRSCGLREGVLGTEGAEYGLLKAFGLA